MYGFKIKILNYTHIFPKYRGGNHNNFSENYTQQLFQYYNHQRKKEEKEINHKDLKGIKGRKEGINLNIYTHKYTSIHIQTHN